MFFCHLGCFYQFYDSLAQKKYGLGDQFCFIPNVTCYTTVNRYTSVSHCRVSTHIPFKASDGDASCSSSPSQTNKQARAL